jgi:hypothetical protein
VDDQRGDGDDRENERVFELGAYGRVVRIAALFARRRRMTSGMSSIWSV